LSTPFDELSATPGIGQKKISSLVKLLHRATRDEPPAVPFGLTDLAAEINNGGSSNGNSNGGSGRFDPSLVSEALWSRWREAVKRHSLGHERLGRLAPSLRNLPTVIWHTPLSQYVDHTVAEIRQLRTHGEKRVHCVLEIFHAVYERISSMGMDSDLAIRLTPRFVPPIESWIAELMDRPDSPQREEVRDRLSIPLLDQIKTDCGDTVHRVAEERLGIRMPAQSVRAQAHAMGVTRARVYQLLDDCSKILKVRWPEGKRMLDTLARKFEAEEAGKHVDLNLFYATKELCFPDKQHGEIEEADHEAEHDADVVADVRG
jgi:hypothetical protein